MGDNEPSAPGGCAPSLDVVGRPERPAPSACWNDLDALPEYVVALEAHSALIEARAWRVAVGLVAEADNIGKKTSEGARLLMLAQQLDPSAAGPEPEPQAEAHKQEFPAVQSGEGER